MLKIVQGCSDSRLASRQSWHTCEACRGAEESCQLLHYRTKVLELATQPNREAKSPDHPVWGKLTFRIPSYPTIYRPLYPRYLESFQREFWERNPREKQDWFIHNHHIETLQIPLPSSSPLLNHWEAHYQNLYSPYPYLWEGHLVFGKQFRRDQFHIS